MSILNKHIKKFNLIQIELENLGFTEFEHRIAFYTFRAQKSIGELSYLLSFHLSTKGISLSYVYGDIMVNPVNKILNQFIPDLSDNNELITLKNHSYGGELKDFEKSLITHARIENEILLPKAMVIEAKVKQFFSDRIRFN